MASFNNSSTNYHDHVTMDPWFKCALFIVSLATCVLGTMGNLFIIFLIVKRRKLKRVIHLLTLNLAVCDLLVLMIYLPSQLYLLSTHMKWHLGPLSCRFFYIVNAFTVNASICTLVAISRDRYLAVCRPMTTQRRSVASVLKVWLPLIWITSFAVTLPLLFVVDIHVGYCVEMWPTIEGYQTYWLLLFCMQIVVPLIFFALVYSFIVYQFTNRTPDDPLVPTSARNHQTRHSARRTAQKRKLLKMSIMLIVVYAVCSSPQHIVFLFDTYGNMQQHDGFAPYAFSTANYLMVLNSALNPIIYGSHTDEMKKYIGKTLPWLKTMKNAVSSIVGRKRPTASFVGYYTVFIQMSLLNLKL